ncbi:MAG: class I tRNA ligase family protein [Alphaproteobacteria bacterium]
MKETASLPRLYLTTPIYYVNGDPHIGHAHTTIMADIQKRAAMMRGLEVFLTTGTDEHGQKNQEAAEKSGLPEEEYLRRQAKRFQDVFDRLEVGYDMFVRTSRPYHMEQVQEVERRLKELDLLVQKPYRGLYCVGCEQFKKPSDLDDQGRCVDHLTVPDEMDEVNWFLRIEPYREWLVDHIENTPIWIQPERFRNEVLAMLREPLEDMCISRPKSRVKLGVELPFDSDYVTYVWFDALINYLTNVGWPDESYMEWWPDVEHLIGKDIVKTHCIYWPIMLKALSIDLPQRLSVHGYWIGSGGQKMSKSLGNVVDPVEVLDKLGAEALRFYLAKNMRTGSDSQISMEMLATTYNADLANKIGNLMSRVVKFTARHFDGVVPAAQLHEDDKVILQSVADGAAEAHREVTLHTIPRLALTAVELAETLNVYIDTVAPWTLIKEPENRERVASVLYAMLDSLRLLFEMLHPVIPVASRRGLEAIGAEAVPGTPHVHSFEPLRLVAGSPLDAEVTLFPRVE